MSEARERNGSLRLRDWYYRPGICEATPDSFDSIIRGHSTQPEQMADINFDPEIKNYLFQGNPFDYPQHGDLRATDIQRNRDHGLPSYNDYREYCGLPRAQSWAGFRDFIPWKSIEKLQTLYESFEDVDLSVGAALETHVNATMAGPTILCIMTEQFYRTRVGDRFFFERGDDVVGFTPREFFFSPKINAKKVDGFFMKKTQ